MTEHIDYFFTPSSPWTYLGHARFVSLAATYELVVHVKPVDLAGKVFPVSGGLPVTSRPKQRLAYRRTELHRWSTYLGIPLNLSPRVFPVATDLAARMIVAADIALGARDALELAGRMMAGVWVHEQDIADTDTLLKIAIEAGVDGPWLLAAANDDGTKERYEQNSREAIERHVFGAPFYIYRQEPFWGQDRLDFLERALMKH
jgi:2-hydroxychromene-2-carboxylate isomerase